MLAFGVAVKVPLCGIKAESKACRKMGWYDIVPSGMKRIVVVVNKKWEAAPILGVFRAPYAAGTHASSKPFDTGKVNPQPEMWPDPTGAYNFEYRYVLSFGDSRVECWCLADFEDTSDSGKKSVYIPKIVADGQPDLVIAMGTAAGFGRQQQGAVMVGCRAFMHAPVGSISPTQPEWPANLLDKMLESSFADSFNRLVASLGTYWGVEVGRRLLTAPSGQTRPKVIMRSDFTAVGDVNVTDYTKYKLTDPEAVDACRKADSSVVIASVETTSALIRAKTDPAPFLFISGIANEFGYFNRDVSDTEYAENFAASHNMGVVLAWLLPALVAF